MNNTGVVVGGEQARAREELLMAQVAEQDHAAFTELFDRLSPMVLGVLVRLLRQRAVAEEALQETFLQCWLQAEAYRPEQSSPRAWLLMIARSRGLDRLRRERSRGQREETVERLQDRRAVLPIGTARLESVELRQRVEDSLSRLPPEQSACLSLVYGEDLSHTEVAQRLAAPLGTVKSRIRLGMSKMAAALA